MRKIRILWTDDEIEVLKAHVLFLREKGYEIDTCTNGIDTVDLVRHNPYDLIFLDETMPGLSGLETLRLIKEIRSDIPVVMITKNEEEGIMEAAIGSEMADYLIKPVKPNQILLVIKRITEQKRLVTEKTTTNYRQEFGSIGNLISSARNHNDWSELYRKITFWESELEKSTDSGMSEILKMQENDANNAFVKYLTCNYQSWLDPDAPEKPILSPSLFSKKIFPHVRQGKPLCFKLKDKQRIHQCKMIAS
jgi:DNA-binding response OmpR family regulator